MKTKEFIGKFNEEEVIQKMQCVKSPEEAYAVAKEYGVTDSLEEFVEEMTKFKAAIDELSEEDLEAVAGGLSPEIVVTIATAISVTAPITAAATVTVTAASLVVTAAATVSAAVSASGTLVSTMAASASV